jgi:hypothetical protein
LTHLWIPPTGEYIDDGAFANGTSLLSVEVPESLKHVRFVGHYEDDGDEAEEGDLCGYNSLVNVCLLPSHE